MSDANVRRFPEVHACSVSDIFDHPAFAELTAEYSAECANPLLGNVAPNRASYEALERTGFAQCFGAYCDGTLRGFAMVLACVVPHYGRTSAAVESVFVSSEARGTGLGRMLIEAIEDQSSKRGCTAVLYSAPIGSKFAELLFLDSDRYLNTGYTFCRRLQ